MSTLKFSKETKKHVVNLNKEGSKLLDEAMTLHEEISEISAAALVAEALKDYIEKIKQEVK